jgi:phage recombination protein Bet
MSNEISEIRHSGSVAAIGEAGMLNVLQSSLYPGAALDSIRMVLDYCRAAGLDPLQKPVHIVPMWDRNIGGMRDVIMPGVNLYRIQASRSGHFAGISEPEFGPEVTRDIGGQTITYPEWCKVTVKRQLATGIVCDFTSVEYWMENYAVKGGKEKSVAPNAMWTKRPRGQIAKCASAQALRSAFPEIAAQYTAEEMEGKELHHDDMDVLDQPKNFGLTPARYKVVRKTAGEALQAFNEDREFDAYAIANAITEEDERLALWSILKPHSALRTSLKKSGEEERKKQTELDETPQEKAA